MRREELIVQATRELFDERGLRDAPMDEIAGKVGINKALIYRHFSSQEELFVQTVTLYLGELAGLLRAANEGGTEEEGQRIGEVRVRAAERLRRVSEVHADYCLAHPAYSDCALSLLRRPADELRELVSDAVWIRLAQGMADCLGIVARILAELGIEDPDLVANLLYTQALGMMQLARLGVGVREAAPGVPGAFAVDPAVVRDECVKSALAFVGA